MPATTQAQVIDDTSQRRKTVAEGLGANDVWRWASLRRYSLVAPSYSFL